MLPLGAEDHRLGVAALRFDPGAGRPDPDRRSLALAMVQDIGRALERARLADELESARVQGETERLRSALLSSVSHDLRSPLASMIGAAGTLLQLPQKAARAGAGRSCCSRSLARGSDWIATSRTCWT